MFGLWNARFLLQLITINFKFQMCDFLLWWKVCTFNGTTLSLSSFKDEKGTCCWSSVTQLLNTSWILSFGIKCLEETYKILEETNSSVSTIQMEDLIASNFVVEKMDDKFLSTYMVSQSTQQPSLQTLLRQSQISLKGYEYHKYLFVST